MGKGIKEFYTVTILDSKDCVMRGRCKYSLTMNVTKKEAFLCKNKKDQENVKWSTVQKFATKLEKLAGRNKFTVHTDSEYDITSLTKGIIGVLYYEPKKGQPAVSVEIPKS